MKTSRWESIDRDMSSWVLTCVHNGIRFYLSDSGTYTDRFENARRYRWVDLAEADASEHAEVGFKLRAMTVPAAFALAVGRAK